MYRNTQYNITFDLCINVYHVNIILYLYYKTKASNNLPYNNNYNIYNSFDYAH